MLIDARTQCDYLIVGLHIDPSLERTEKHKPIETLYERRLKLEACQYVDLVLPYETEAELMGLLKDFEPDVRIIGSDWKEKEITGGNLGIPIYWHERRHNFSSSELRKRIYDSYTAA